MTGDSEIIESESIRLDRRAARCGSVIVAHHTRESFMRATGADLKAKIPQLPAAECHRGMLAAWQEKYGDPQ